jgi:hypothetical protein
MLDPNSMSDEERELLEEIAKAKGQTLEEALVALGHSIAPGQDTTVSLEGQSEPEPVVAPVTVEAPVAVSAPGVAAELITDDLAIEVTPEFEPPPPPAAEADEADEPPPADDDDDDDDDDDYRGADSTIKQICVQCGWEKGRPTIPEPEHKDKIGFLQSVLGHKVFSKRYLMFGGQLRVTFRTLSIREIDTLYQAAFRAQKEEQILTTADYYEYLNRLRLYLQLTSFSAKSTSMQIKLPDGLSKATHEGCASYWDDFLKEQALFEEDKPLIVQVQNYVIEKVMKTENLQRTITHECAQFNRLVARLEACVDNPDFWEETEQPS